MFKKFTKDREGSAMVEFGIVMPLLLAMAFGAADLGRLFVESAILAAASKAGAIQGYRTTKDSTDTTAMESRILSGTAGLAGVTASGVAYCDCPDNPGVQVSCSNTTCTDFGQPRVYVKASAVKQFKTAASYVGMPNLVDMKSDTYLRVQ